MIVLKNHKIALSSNDQNLWREFRNSRNKVNRMNTFLKKQYFYNKLNIKKLENDANDNENNLKEDPKFSKTMWKTIKQLTGNNKNVPLYINVDSNHPPTVIKAVPNGINTRLSMLS